MVRNRPTVWEETVVGRTLASWENSKFLDFSQNRKFHGNKLWQVSRFREFCGVLFR